MTGSSNCFQNVIGRFDMPKSFIEKQLQFTFSDNWSVEKYDEHPFFLDHVKKLQNTKAIDFIGFAPDGKNYFIEVTDYHGYSHELTKMLSTNALALETSEKVRDSIAGIVGCHRNYPHSDGFTTVVKKLIDANVTIRVILLLESDTTRNESVWKAQASTLADAIKNISSGSLHESSLST